MVVAIACVAACVARLRRVHRAAAFDFAALSTALGRSADLGRLAEMRELLVAEGASWEGELVEAALSARDIGDRTALVNEHLGDVGADLGWGKRIPRAGAWISWLTGLGLVFFARTQGPLDFADIVSIAAWAVVGVAGALFAGREADRLETEVRRGIDMWVARVLDAAKVEDQTPVAGP
jgi:hypothetical protein